jgi:hypothetical protein
MSCSQWFWRRSRRVTLTLLAPALVGVLAASDAVQADGSVTFGYDQTGRVSSAAYDNGLCVVYAYDQAGQSNRAILRHIERVGMARTRSARRAVFSPVPALRPMAMIPMAAGCRARRCSPISTTRGCSTM